MKFSLGPIRKSSSKYITVCKIHFYFPLMMLDTDLLDAWPYDKYETSVLPYHIYNMCLEEPWIFSLYFLHFHVLTHYYSNSGGETKLFFYDKKNNCYIVRNSASTSTTTTSSSTPMILG